MAMTVTATMSGTAANEHIYLWIRVLTGATETGGAAVSNIAAAGGVGVTASMTPNASSSLPCFAITADNWGGSYTAATNNTIDSGSADPDTWGAGFGRYTGTVTGGTPLTFGASGVGGSCDYGTWAAYEVPSSGGGTPAVDASSPALASATGAGIKTVTSASFTPPAGSVVVAMVCCGGSGSSGSMVMTVTGGSLTWTQRAGNPTVTDQSTFVVTATVPGGAGGGGAPALPYRGGQAHRRRAAVRRQRAFPPPPPVLITAAAAGAGAVTTAVTQSATATAAGAGSVSASSGPLVITGLAGGANGYFADNGGNPHLVWGDAVWALPGNVGRWSSGAWMSDYDTYFTTRQGQGVNVLYTKPMGTQQSGNIDNNGGTFDSLFPFQGGAPTTGTAGANPSSGLTSAYWARIDYMLNSAAARGITVFLNAIGYSSDFDSGPGPLAGKSTTEFTAYGTALGTRYAGQQNIVWNLADDYFGDNDTLITAFLTGLRGAGDTHAVSIENFPETMSRFTVDGAATHTAWGFTNAQYNFVYSYNVIYYGTELGYTLDGTVPVIAGDGYFYQGNATYSGGSGAFAFDRAFRQDAWHALSSGARGKIHGDESVWEWQTGSQAAAAAGWFWAHSALAIRTAFEALPGWQNLIPDTSSALVTAGRGTHASAFSSGGGGGQYEVAFTDSYVTASRTPDSGSGSSLAVVYLSHGTTITIDQTKLVSGYTATWIDPVSGATSSATTGTTYNSTAKGSNSQGDPDWVLAFQAPGAASGTASAVGAGSVTAVATVIAPAAAAGASSVTAKAVQVAAASAAGASAVTAKATQAAQASAAGAGAALAAATEIAVASVAGAGAVSGVVTQVAGAAAAGAGSVTAAGSAGGASTASAAGAGAVSDVVTQIAPASAAGAGLATAAVTQAAQASAAGTGAAGPAPVTQTATGAAAGAGAATDIVTQIVTASAAGAGSVTAAGSAAGSGATASVAGTGAVATAVTQSAGASAAGAGSAAGVAAQAAKATAAGAGAVNAAGAITGTASAAGTGSATAKAAQAATGGAVGAGALAALAAQRAIAAINGTGTVNAAGNIQLAFTVGILTAADVPLATLGATATAGQATLTASDTSMGGPG